MLICRECVANFIISYIVIYQNFFSLSGTIAFRYKIILTLLRERYNSRIFCKKKKKLIGWKLRKQSLSVLHVSSVRLRYSVIL